MFKPTYIPFTHTHTHIEYSAYNNFITKFLPENSSSLSVTQLWPIRVQQALGCRGDTQGHLEDSDKLCHLKGYDN